MSNYITVCEQAARASGAVLLEKMGKVAVREKAPADLVTEADLASQELVCRKVLDAFPDHQVIGEENVNSARASHARAEYHWIVDPLDGTTNYVHGVPHFSVSLALEHNERLLVGTVFDPVSAECFTAVAGEGSYLNGRRIHTSQIATLSDALAAVGFPPGVSRDSLDLAVFTEALESFQALRRTGSAALNLSYLAAGRFDAAWSFSTKIWDVAAGVLIIREAGGVVTAPDGGPFELTQGHFSAAANEQLHAQLQALLARVGVTRPGPRT